MQPISLDLFVETSQGPRLLGGRRLGDKRIVFPLPNGADRKLYEPITLAPEGLLWSWTIQRFQPKKPPYAGAETERNFQPYAVGYVELPGEVIVESRLEFDSSTPRIGLRMRLALVPFVYGSDGAPRNSYIFRAVE